MCVILVTLFPRFTGESRYPRQAWVPAFRRESTLFDAGNFSIRTLERFRTSRTPHPASGRARRRLANPFATPSSRRGEREG
jgi:hypothetical protein